MAKLGDVCEFQSGGTPSRGVKEFYDGTIPWITTVALNGGLIDESCAISWITEYALRASAAKLVPANSIMVGMRVGVGKVAVNNVAMSTSQDIVSLINIDEQKWNKAYLCELIQAKSEYLKAQARGATIKGIKIETLASIEVPNLGLNKQQEIASVIASIKHQITLRKQQLRKIDLLVKSRFVEMFGGIPYGDWIEVKNVCSIITDGTHQPPKFVSDGIPFIFVSNLSNNILTYNSDKYISDATYAELIKRTPIEQGDILLTTVGSYGHPAVVKSNQKFLFQRHIAYMKPINTLVNSDYLHSFFLSPEGQRQIDERVKGIAQKTLNLSEIKSISLPLPPLCQQTAFSAFVSHVDKSKAAVQKSLDQLETLKKALMQKYFG